MVYGEAVRRGITLVSVGHRHSLRRFHRLHLHLGGTGGWHLETIEAADAEVDHP